MKYIIIIIQFFFLHTCSNKAEHKIEYLRHVGDIPFDSRIDDTNFTPCHEDLATVHYAFNNPNLYEGEKPAIVKEFKNLSLPKINKNNGYVIIRFMINCEGKTGRFRVEQLDNNYEPKKFSKELVNTLLSKTKSLNKWIPATFDEKKYDYYKYLTFKIVDNQIATILP